MTNFETITEDASALADFMVACGVCPHYEDKALQLCSEQPKPYYTCGDCWFRWLELKAKVEP